MEISTYNPSTLIKNAVKMPNGVIVVRRKELTSNEADLRKFYRTLARFGWNFKNPDAATLCLKATKYGDIQCGVYDSFTEKPETSKFLASSSYRSPVTYILSKEEMEQLNNILRNA